MICQCYSVFAIILTVLNTILKAMKIVTFQMVPLPFPCVTHCYTWGVIELEWSWTLEVV